ncbi:2-hydroxyacid dehydrogenase, partial [Burkholderia sp. Ac-20392]|nr:2-hydroxyacid dehydrogenase [Burkholderia sp. Ac-20392]
MTARPGVLALVPLPDTTRDALRRDYVLHDHPDGMPADFAAAGTIRAV